MTETSVQSLGRVGFTLSMLPWLCQIATHVLCPEGSTRAVCLLGCMALAGAAIGFVFSLHGLFGDTRRGYALAGALSSVAAAVWLFGRPLLASAAL